MTFDYIAPGFQFIHDYFDFWGYQGEDFGFNVMGSFRVTAQTEIDCCKSWRSLWVQVYNRFSEESLFRKPWNRDESLDLNLGLSPVDMYITFEKSGEFCDCQPEAVFFGLAVAAPVVCHFFAQSTLSRAGLSVAVSIVLMSLCLVVGEARASLPDFDIVFGVSLIGWNVLAIIYAVAASLALTAIVRLLKRLQNPKDTAKHEE